MDIQISSFSPAQWDFLAVLEAFSEAASIDILCKVAPLSPGELIDLISVTRDAGWLKRGSNNTFLLGDGLPAEVLARLRQINTSSRINALQKKIQDLGVHKELSARIHANLMGRSGHEYEAGVLEYDFAMKAMERGAIEVATEQLERTLSSLKKGLGDRNCDMLFISACLALSNLLRRRLKGLSKIPRLLEQARIAAQRLGDRRARALVSLHIGRNFTYMEKHDEALPLLASGLEEVKDLGDEDILSQSAELAGTYYFIQGLYKDATDYFENALHSDATSKSFIINTALPQLMGYSLYSIGQHARAIGVLDCHWRQAMMASEPILANSYRTSLGLILLLMGYKKQAVSHLSESLKEAQTLDNHWSLYEAEGSLAYYHFTEGRFQEAYETAVRCWSQSAKADPFVRRPIWGHVLEMFYEFHKQGYPPVPGYNFEEELQVILTGVNIHLRGVARRIQAMQATEGNQDPAGIKSLLEQSEADLIRSGDPIHLARTRIELSRLALKHRDHEGALDKALKAWELLSGYPRESFPDDLKTLVHISNSAEHKGERGDILKRFMEVLDMFSPLSDIEAFSHRIVAATCRFFKAERGGLFLFEVNRPQLLAGYNLTGNDIEADAFRFNLDLILEAYKHNQPLVSHPKQAGTNPTETLSSAILCLPFERGGSHIRYILYHDSTYEDTDFEFIDIVTLKRIGSHLGKSFDRLEDYLRLMENSARAGLEGSLPDKRPEDWEIKAQSPIMLDLLNRARQVADSEASVLILGETGVGKELLAKQIHAMSSRRNEPFIEVEFTSIPETLVENELFGHEKGAFTGADRQKIGRMELANHGTLFIDEVGDIPKPVQIKILRALQEKTFVRVGGTRKLSSDFRLIAATNRDLEKAVEQGNFREDLYYRLNVVPLTIPPLKNRGKDIILLAQYFLDHYARKYKRHNLAFTPEEEEQLREYPWPGNVRELRNIIERAVILSSGDNPELKLPVESKSTNTDQFSDDPTIEELQRRYIKYILAQTGGRVSGPDGAAAILGIKRTTLYSRMRKLGIA